MKRILLVSGSLDMGGVESVVMQIVRLSDKKEFSFDILVYGNRSYYYEKEAIEVGCNILRIPEPRRHYLSYYHSLKKILKNYGPYDIVHSHIFFNSSIVMMAAKRSGVPLCIAHSHSIKRQYDDQIIKKVAYGIMRILLKKYTDKFVACSKQAGEYVFGKDGFNKKGIVIFNPINIEKFAFSQKSRNKIRRELKISEDEFVVGQVGRLASVKNQKFLLEVFEQLCYKRDSKLLLVGDGELRFELEKYAEKLGIKNKVRFTGSCSDVSDFLSAMDCFVMTSKHEGFGIVLIEAMANGLNCICETNAIVCEIKEIEYCQTITGFNVDDWCNMLITSLGRDKKMKYRNEKLKKFNTHTFLKNLNDLYLN